MSNGKEVGKSPLRVWEIANRGLDFLALATSCDFGVYEYLEDAPEGKSAKEVAKHVKADETATGVLLDYLMALNLVEKKQKNGQKDAVYSLTEESRDYLTLKSPKNIRSLVTLYKFGPSYEAFHFAFVHGKKMEMARDGQADRNLFREVPPAMYPSYQGSMDEIGSWIGKFVNRAFDLGAAKSAIDMGGGRGHLAFDLCSLYPDMSATVLELPHVVKNSHIYTNTITDERKDRVKFVVGDIFEYDTLEKLPKFDVVILVHMIQCWSDEDCLVILKNAHKLCNPGGHLLIGDVVLEDDDSNITVWKMQKSTRRMVVTASGLQRKKSQYQQLIKKAGFVDCHFKFSNNNLVDAILAKKA